jgi:uncharacterized protein YcbX
MSTGRVAALYRYPVKGLSPEIMPALELRAGEGLAHDRAYALALATTQFDEDAPAPLAKTFFLMLMRNAQLAALSTTVDTATAMLSIRKNGAPTLQASLIEPTGRAAIAAFFASFLGIAPPRVVHGGAHRFTDVSVVSTTMMRAISVINLESVRALSQALGRPLDPLRFRANVYIDGLPAWTELDWVGHDVSFGPVRMRGTLRTKRCGATNVNPATAARDENLPLALLRHFGHPDMGVYMDVVGDGRIAADDRVVSH